MEAIRPLTVFFSLSRKDFRISTTHIGIYSALLFFRIEKGLVNPIHAYSHEIMAIAKVSSTATYHKSLRQLSEYGYLEYHPSYKKNIASTIVFKE
jgi:hypothetical protein